MRFIAIALALVCLCFGCVATHAEPAFGQGIMVGEVTETSAVVQVRVTDGDALIDGDVFDDGDALRDGEITGIESRLEFHYMRTTAARKITGKTGWSFRAVSETDYIVTAVIDDLEPGQEYIVWCEFPDPDILVHQFDPERDCYATFRTNNGNNNVVSTRFHVVTGMNYDKFYDPDTGYQGEDRALGYPALEAMRQLGPDFVVFTGDNVYYDKPPHAQTLAGMRAKWHRQFAQPRMIDLLSSTPAYWMKDDHDHRYNDSDRTGDRFPPHELGAATFREQVPIFEQGDDGTPLYRTHRVSKDLQIWLLEGRDHRNPNRMEDGPDKSLWGIEQRDWLKRTLVASDARYKLLISPTPMVGPDDAYKRDNHTNPRGFRHEGEAFKRWAAEQGLWDGGTYLICGDRHWQYHSIDPSGAHEFSCGAICDANSRLGRLPGDDKSTDPEGLIIQPYTQQEASGGFLSVVITPGEGEAPGALRFEFYDETGEVFYAYQPGPGG